MYRYVRRVPLDTGHKYGDIIKDGDIPDKSIRRFLESGTLVKVSTPPLSEVPAFEDRVATLEAVGVVMISDLVQANPSQLAKKIRKTAATVRRWQHEAVRWLAPDEIKSTSN